MNPRAFLLTALLGSSASTAVAQETPAPNIEVVRDGQGRRCTINHSTPRTRVGPTWTCEQPDGTRVRVQVLPQPVVRESPRR